MAELPPNFTFIREIRSRPDGVSFAGIVVSTKGIRATKGTHSNLEVVVQDEFDDASDSAITLRYFCWPEDFPDEPEVGDIVFVRHAKASEWNDKMTATSNWELKTDLFIFKSASVPIVQKGYAPSLSGLSSLPHTSNREAVLPKESELKVVLDRRMRSAVRSKQLKQQPSQSTPSKPTRLALIKDLGINVFHDINAQVVKIWSENQSCTDIHVTDYTTNHHLFWHEEPNLEDGMQSRWQGPYGQMTLAVRLYGVNAQWTNDNVSVGDFIFLRNVHLKLSNMNKLEGALHEDRLHPNQNDIRRLLQQSAISEIQKRKADYERQQNAKFIKNEPKKPSAKAAAKKREEKKQMQRLQRELEQKEAEEAEVARSGVNPDVRARDPEIKLSTLAEVQDNSHLNTNTMNGDAMKLPFINTKYRIRGRVVDFYPPKLEDFAHSMIDPTWNPLDVYTRSSWEWGFVLLMEDATASAGQQPSRIRVIVSNDDAEFLLKMKAADLSDANRLLRLKMKMSNLCGNLVALKESVGDALPLDSGDDRLENRPFDCCIVEYGHKSADGKYHRYHKLFGTRKITIPHLDKVLSGSSNRLRPFRIRWMTHSEVWGRNTTLEDLYICASCNNLCWRRRALSMFIRPITRADLPEVAAITHAAFWDDSVYQYMQPRQHLYPDDVRRQQVLRLRLRLARSDCHGFVMVTEESDANWKGRSEVAGFAFLERHGGNDENAQKWNNDSWFKKLERYLLSWEIFYEKKVMDRASDAQRINKWIEYCNAHDFVNLIEPVWHVAVLAVSPRHQRKGVGGKFIQFSQGLAADENIPMMLEASEAGLPLYQKLGCKIVDETVVDECMKGITLLWEPEHLKGKWVEDCGDGIFKVKGSQ